ncbi:MAG: hypothetical protein LBU45_09125, partial [Azoarcus sp.]|nr:hypothetical protein [Azoarcus sp.]
MPITNFAVRFFHRFNEKMGQTLLVAPIDEPQHGLQGIDMAVSSLKSNSTFQVDDFAGKDLSGSFKAEAFAWAVV